MKHTLWLVCIILSVLMAACSPGTVPTLASADENAQASVVEKPVKATATPRASIKEDFSSGDNWLAELMVTTQAQAGNGKSSVQVKDGMLNFIIPDKESYLYTLFKKPQKADVSIEVTFTSSGLSQNGVALVCRAKEDYSAWYEARVSASGMYAFYAYDETLKDAGLNPYRKIVAGTVDKYSIYATTPNTLRFTCKGDQLILDVNGGKFIKVQQDAGLSEEGLVGIGTMSYDVIPVMVAYDNFSISEP